MPDAGTGELILRTAQRMIVENDDAAVALAIRGENARPIVMAEIHTVDELADTIVKLSARR